MTIQNSHLGVNIADTGRFNLGAFHSSGNWNLSYWWPDDPGTSFTSLKIDGTAYYYGGGPDASIGTLIQPPTNRNAVTNDSAWLIAGVAVQQTLQIVTNPQTGQDDLLKITYHITNTMSTSKHVGLRMMIDTTIDGNDGAIFRVPNTGLVTNETQYFGSAIPQPLYVLKAVADTTHVAAVSVGSSADPTNASTATTVSPPDALILADWNHLVNIVNLYDYTPTGTIGSDSAYALYWYPAILEPNATRTYESYYGLSSMQYAELPPLGLSVLSPASLAYQNNRYTPNPFDVTAIVQNVSPNNLTIQQPQVTLTLPNELELVSGSPTYITTTLAPGEEYQVSWQVRLKDATTHDRNLPLSVTASASNANAVSVSKTVFVPKLPVPDFTSSYFIQYPNAQSAYNLGCQVHASMPTKGGIVTLIFGSPRAFGANGEAVFDNSTPIVAYGTKLLPPANKYLRISDIKLFSMWFVRGYQSQNATCLPNKIAPIVIALGTSNSKICNEDKIKPCVLVSNNALTTEHGVTWADMITDLNNAIPGHQILFTGGYDAEFGPGWNSVGTLNWAIGYSNSATASLYNFGDCNDCARRIPRTQWTQTQINRLDMVYKLSWQLDWAKPLPEIYLNAYQDEWYNVMRYGREAYPDMPPMILAGVMTDCQYTIACNPNNELTPWTQYPYPGLEGRDNFPPKIGWLAMTETLGATDYPNSNPALIMMHHPNWLTDIQLQPKN